MISPTVAAMLEGTDRGPSHPATRALGACRRELSPLTGPRRQIYVTTRAKRVH